MKLGTMLRGAAGSLTVGCALALGSGERPRRVRL